MKIKVLMPFSDKFTKEMYNAGQVLDFDEDRAANVIDRGLAEAVETTTASIQEEVTPEEDLPKKKTTKKTAKK